MVQLTVMKITGYGPWTLTLGSDREHRLQILQASLYGRMQELFSDRGSLVFPNRADEFFAVTNGLGMEDHIEIQRDLRSRFDVKVSMAIGCAQSPFEANILAHRARLGKPAEPDLDIYGMPETGKDGHVTVLHLDVEDLTSMDGTSSPYEISAVIFGLYARMSEFFRRNDSLTFFMGGDNFMVVAGSGAREAAAEFLGEARVDGMAINCGVGTGETARQAAGRATASLDAIRKMRDSGGARPEIYELS